MNAHMQYKQPRKRRGCRGGCILTVLTVLVALLVIAGTGWLFFLRPYLHNIAQTEIDHALSAMVQQFQLPPEAALLPPGQKIPLTEEGINNTIVLHLSPASPMQQPETRITPDGVRISFKINNFDSAISLVPKVDNAFLVVSDVKIDGVAGLIMSPEELTPLLNKHLADAQRKLPRAVTAVELQDHEMLLTLG